MKFFFLLFFVLALFFKFYPETDLYVSSLFYKKGAGFYLSDNPFCLFIYHGINYLAYTLAVFFSAALVAGIVFKKKLLGLDVKAWLFLLVTLIMAPGIVVNAILKEEVGRARPAAIIEFGGTQEFSPPFTVTNSCETNCSFVSGHSSMGFYMMAFGLVAFGLWRRRLILSGFLFGCVVSLVRIVQGRHFFTDTLFAFFFVWTTITLIYALMYGDEEK